MTFIQMFGGAFVTKRVLVTPGPESPGRRTAEFDALVQAESVDFNVDTPIYEGDLLEWDDPRGGQKQVRASEVQVFDAGSMNLRHISVKWTNDAPTPTHSANSGHAIVVNGNNVNIAFEGSTITQQVPIQTEYAALVDVVGRALACIEQTAGIDADEVEVARETAISVIEESTKPAPDAKTIKRLLPALRGVLTSAANAGAGAAASQLVSQLIT